MSDYVLVARGFKALVDLGKLKTDPDSLMTLGEGVREATEIVRTRAVYNTGGYPVTYEGGTFRVSVRTGALRGSIEAAWPYGSPLVGRVFVNGAATSTSTVGGNYSRTTTVHAYAAAIENGHDAIDLKKTMMGKTIPFFASRGQKSVGPYSARGLVPVVPGQEKVGARFQNQALNARLMAKGKGPMTFEKKGGKAAYSGRGGSNYFIAFRKVGKTGWIIPAAKPRPFMKAALEGTRTQVRRAIQRQAKAMILNKLTES